MVTPKFLLFQVTSSDGRDICILLEMGKKKVTKPNQPTPNTHIQSKEGELFRKKQRPEYFMYILRLCIIWNKHNLIQLPAVCSLGLSLRCWCLMKSELTLKLFPCSELLQGFLSTWTPWCCSRAVLPLKFFLHMVQEKVFFFRWVLWWARRPEAQLKVLSHSLHLYGLSPVWTLWWTTRLAFLLKLFPHSAHTNTFSLVWICRWVRSLQCPLKPFPHSRHLKGFSSQGSFWPSASRTSFLESLFLWGESSQAAPISGLWASHTWGSPSCLRSSGKPFFSSLSPKMQPPDGVRDQS